MGWSYRQDQSDQIYSDGLGPAVCDGYRQNDVPASPYPPVAAGGGEVQLTFAQSVKRQLDGFTITLLNDTAAPGNSMLYGTNSSGVRGWYAQPVGGTGTVPTGTGYYHITAGVMDPVALDAQPRDADLDAIAALSTTAFGRGFLPLANSAAALTYVGALPATGIATDVTFSTVYIGTKARLVPLANGVKLEVQNSSLAWIVQATWTQT